MREHEEPDAMGLGTQWDRENTIDYHGSEKQRKCSIHCDLDIWQSVWLERTVASFDSIRWNALLSVRRRVRDHRVQEGLPAEQDLLYSEFWFSIKDSPWPNVTNRWRNVNCFPLHPNLGLVSAGQLLRTLACFKPMTRIHDKDPNVRQ